MKKQIAISLILIILSACAPSPTNPYEAIALADSLSAQAKADIQGTQAVMYQQAQQATLQAGATQNALHAQTTSQYLSAQATSQALEVRSAERTQIAMDSQATLGARMELNSIRATNVAQVATETAIALDVAANIARANRSEKREDVIGSPWFLLAFFATISAAALYLLNLIVDTSLEVWRTGKNRRNMTFQERGAIVQLFDTEKGPAVIALIPGQGLTIRYLEDMSKTGRLSELLPKPKPEAPPRVVDVKSQDPEEAPIDALVRRLLMDSARVVGWNGKVIPRWSSLGYDSNSAWIKATDALVAIGAVIKEDRKGTHLTEEFDNLRDLKMALDHGEIELSPTPALDMAEMAV